MYLKNRQSAYEQGQKELNCIFVDLEKAYDRVQKKELYFCMKKFGMAGKEVGVVHYMYESCKTEVRCSIGVTEEYKVKMGRHQGSALSCFCFCCRDGQTDK